MGLHRSSLFLGARKKEIRKRGVVARMHEVDNSQDSLSRQLGFLKSTREGQHLIDLFYCSNNSLLESGKKKASLDSFKQSGTTPRWQHRTCCSCCAPSTQKEKSKKKLELSPDARKESSGKKTYVDVAFHAPRHALIKFVKQGLGQKILKKGGFLFATHGNLLLFVSFFSCPKLVI